MPVPCLSTTFFVHHFLFLYIFIIFVSVWWFFRSDQDADILFVFAIWHQPTTDICNYVQPHSPTNILRLSLIGPPQRVGRFGWYVYVILLCYLMNLVFFALLGRNFRHGLVPFVHFEIIRFEGKCNRGGTLLLLYYFDVPTDCFEQHLQANMDHDHNAQ